MRIFLLALFAAGMYATSSSADQAGFSGRVVVEVLDEIEFVHKLRLLENVSYLDSGGRRWLAKRGGILDGETVPRQFVTVGDLPFPSEYRKAAVVHDFFSRAKTIPWKEVHRMLYDASIAEGVVENQAKLLYAAVYAGGWRWEVYDGSSCYRSCHTAVLSLAWKPKSTRKEIDPVLQWIMEAGPNLDQIDQRIDAAIRQPGPHIFAQPR